MFEYVWVKTFRRVDSELLMIINFGGEDLGVGVV